MYFTCASHLHSWNPFATNWCFLRPNPQLFARLTSGSESDNCQNWAPDICTSCQKGASGCHCSGPRRGPRLCLQGLSVSLGRSCASRRELHIFGHNDSERSGPSIPAHMNIATSSGTAIGDFSLYRHKPLWLHITLAIAQAVVYCLS